MNNTTFYRTGTHPKDRVDIENLRAALAAANEKAEALDARLEYVAMMADIELPEEETEQEEEADV